MNIGLRVLLGYFLIVALAALLVGKVFVEQVKPGVRQAMEGTLIDTANTLAELASDDMLAGRIADGRFARRLRAVQARKLDADVWGFAKDRSGFRVTVTDARGIVVFDSEGKDLGRDNSRWNDVYRTLRGEYGARSTREDPGDEASTVMHVAAPIRDDQGRIVGVLTVAKPNRAMAPFIARSQQIVARWGLVLMGAALLVGIAAAWWLSRQLGALRRYADAVAAGERAPQPAAAGEFGDLGRALHDIAQARRLLGLLRGARVGGGDFHPGLGGEFLHRIHERQPALIGHPPDRIAVGAATEAMVEALFVVDREAGGLFVMEGAAGFVLAARAGDLHRPPDEGRQRDARAQFVQPLRGEGQMSDPSSSGGEATPPPPFVSSEVETRWRPASRPSTSLGTNGRGGRSLGGLAKWLTISQSPRISASFFARDHGLTRRSASSASTRVAKSCNQTRVTGRRREVKSQNPPC